MKFETAQRVNVNTIAVRKDLLWKSLHKLYIFAPNMYFYRPYFLRSRNMQSVCKILVLWHIQYGWRNATMWILEDKYLDPFFCLDGGTLFSEEVVGDRRKDWLIWDTTNLLSTKYRKYPTMNWYWTKQTNEQLSLIWSWWGRNPIVQILPFLQVLTKPKW